MSLDPPIIDPTFEAKRQEWIRCLDHHDPVTGKLDRNAVMNQVYDMVWCAGVYRVVLKAREIADKDEKGRVKLNGMVHFLLDRCFYHSQLVAVRRLMDKSLLDGAKGVFSLRPLVLDMGKHRAMFTRRNLCAAWNCPLDPAPLREARIEYLWKHRGDESDALELPSECDDWSCERHHAEIDRLCATTPDRRSPEDVVADAVFAGLESKLAQTETMCLHVDKFLAHAATPESRALVNADDARVTFEELWESHENICRVCDFIDCFLLRQRGHHFFPDSAEDLFRYMDQPFATADHVQVLRATLIAYAKNTEAWSGGGMDWLMPAAIGATSQTKV